MGEVKTKDIVKQWLKEIGYDAGKVALKVSYPVTGALPARCQNYLGEKFESYNPITATRSSFLVECLVGFGLELKAQDYPGYELLGLLGFGMTVEGGFRGVYSYLKKKQIGTLITKTPALPLEYLYNTWHEAKEKVLSEERKIPV